MDTSADVDKTAVGEAAEQTAVDTSVDKAAMDATAANAAAANSAVVSQIQQWIVDKAAMGGLGATMFSK